MSTSDETPLKATARIKAIIPQFLVENLEAAIKFYVETLGFRLSFTYSDFYACVERDGYAIHLKLVDSAEPARSYRLEGEHLDAYVYVSDVQKLYEEFEHRGVSFHQTLHATAWGTNEFVVVDNNGYILYFA